MIAQPPYANRAARTLLPPARCNAPCRCVILAVCASAVLAAASNCGTADDWPFFRGSNFNGVSSETGWQSQWHPAGPEVIWRRHVGNGASSVVVSGDRCVTMGSCEAEDEESIWCLSAPSGDTLWKFCYTAPFDARQFEGGPASTPTIDGRFVYALGYLGHLHCLDLETGKVVWCKHLVDDFGGRYSSWKYAGSPLLVDGLLVVDTGAEGNSTVALNPLTGEQIWGNGEDLAGYSTPIPFDDSGGRGVLVFKARAMVAYELATGRELWRIDWRTNYDCNASTPTVFGDKLFVSSGYGGHRARGALFQMGGTPPEQIWLNQDLETKMNSAVVYDGYIYCVSERRSGQLMCCDARDGSVAWSETSFAKYGTLMIADGKLIVLDEKGDLVIAQASPDGYRELARAHVLDDRSWVMPVLAGGRIFAKSNRGEMVCLDVGVDPKP